MKSNLNVCVLVAAVLLWMYGDLCAQLLKDMKQTVDPGQDEELSVLFKEMN